MENPYQADALRGDDSNPFRSPLAEDPADPQVHRSDERLNPWFTMWTRPRQTIRQVIETDPRRYVLLLAILGGMAGSIDFENSLTPVLQDRVFEFLGSIVGGALGGLVYIFLYGWLTKVAGQRLGGVATTEQTRAALAWSQIPGVWILPVSLVVGTIVTIFGPDLYRQLDEDTFPVAALLLGLPFLVIGVWQFILGCCAVGEVHQFSSLRGFGTLLLSGLMLTGIAIAIAIPVVVIMALTGGFG